MADITFQPTCGECGAVLWDEDINCEYLDTTPVDRFVHKKTGVILHPSKCPKCGARFDRIVMPTEIPFQAPQQPPYLHLQGYKGRSRQ